MRDSETGIAPAATTVLVKVRAADEVSKGGIIIPDTARDRNQLSAESGTVIAIGDGVLVEVGAEVTFTRYAGKTPCGKDGRALENYRIVKDTDIWCDWKADDFERWSVVDGQPGLMIHSHVIHHANGLIEEVDAIDATHIFYGESNGMAIVEKINDR